MAFQGVTSDSFPFSLKIQGPEFFKAGIMNKVLGKVGLAWLVLVKS